MVDQKRLKKKRPVISLSSFGHMASSIFLCNALCAILAVSMFITPLNAAGTADAALSVSVSPVSAFSGEQLTFTVWLNDTLYQTGLIFAIYSVSFSYST
jgi:hypothetical protein